MRLVRASTSLRPLVNNEICKSAHTHTLSLARGRLLFSSEGSSQQMICIVLAKPAHEVVLLLEVEMEEEAEEEAR